MARNPALIASTNISETEGELRPNSGSDGRYPAGDKPTLHLVETLCRSLEKNAIGYCHWKSNNALNRSASGENDLDLLVSRADILRFTEILSRMGFKRARAPKEKWMPGVVDYFGYDQAEDKLVHVHAHYQLILGHDMSKNYHLPVERPYLESAAQGDLFKVPAVEFEFIVFVIRMILKHSTWDAILGRQGTLSNTERQELAYLNARIDHDRIDSILKQHLPYIDGELFRDCIQALQPACSTWSRVKTGFQLQASLQANARRPKTVDILLKLWRRAVLAIKRRVFKSSPKYLLDSGGAMIAIAGGDGAGKSTAVTGLQSWLSKYFELTTIHMGKPAWSWTTITIRGILKFGKLLGLFPGALSLQETLDQNSIISPGYPWLLREVSRARDRYLTYIKARRFAAQGGLVILDRFPVPEIRLMDGPLTAEFVNRLATNSQSKRFLEPHPNSRLTRALVNLEKRYYQKIVSTDVLIVLRVNPEIAVQRKKDEKSSYVRARSREIWELDWERTDAHVIEADKSKDEVLRELKTLIWSQL